VPDEVVEEAKEKFMAIQTAYELLCEGMETGGAGMKGAVFSGGDLEYAGFEPPQAAAAQPADAAPAPSTDFAAAGNGAAAAPSGPTGASVVSDASGRAPHTATPAAVKDGAMLAEPALLDRSEVDILLRSSDVQAALRDLASDPAAVMRHTGNAVLLGLLFTLTTEGWDQPGGAPPTASAGAAAGATNGGGYHRAGLVHQTYVVKAEAEVAD
jgi:hypothetical protein